MKTESKNMYSIARIYTRRCARLVARLFFRPFLHETEGPSGCRRRLFGSIRLRFLIRAHGSCAWSNDPCRSRCCERARSRRRMALRWRGRAGNVLDDAGHAGMDYLREAGAVRSVVTKAAARKTSTAEVSANALSSGQERRAPLID